MIWFRFLSKTKLCDATKPHILRYKKKELDYGFRSCSASQTRPIETSRNIWFKNMGGGGTLADLTKYTENGANCEKMC